MCENKPLKQGLQKPAGNVQFVGISRCNRTATIGTYSRVDLTMVKYNSHIHSRDEKEKVTLPTQPSKLSIDLHVWEIMEIKYWIQK
jgi:hypothetical protein